MVYIFDLQVINMLTFGAHINKLCT